MRNDHKITNLKIDHFRCIPVLHKEIPFMELKFLDSDTLYLTHMLMRCQT